MIKEVTISVDSKNGFASISKMQGVATKRASKMHWYAKRIESHGLINLGTYDGSKEYKFMYKVEV